MTIDTSFVPKQPNDAIEQSYVALSERICDTLEHELGAHANVRWRQTEVVIDRAEVIEATREVVAVQVATGVIAMATNMPFRRKTDAYEVRNRTIFYTRNGLTDGSVPTLKQVGDEFGLTKERVRQIETRQFHILKGFVRRSGRGVTYSQRV